MSKKLYDILTTNNYNGISDKIKRERKKSAPREISGEQNNRTLQRNSK